MQQYLTRSFCARACHVEKLLVGMNAQKETLRFSSDFDGALQKALDFYAEFQPFRRSFAKLITGFAEGRNRYPPLQIHEPSNLPGYPATPGTAGTGTRVPGSQVHGWELPSEFSESSTVAQLW